MRFLSLNAIVDGLGRRHEMILVLLDISKTTGASNFKIYRILAHDSLYISAGNDITIYFWSAANRTNVSFLGETRTRFALLG